jgi:hypothetical protein
MPINLIPGQKHPVTLKSDEGKDPKPQFLMKFLASRAMARFGTAFDEFIADKNMETGLDKLNALVAGVCVGWRNMGEEWGEFTREKLMQMLEECMTHREIVGLARAILDQPIVPPDDQKN